MTISHRRLQSVLLGVACVFFFGACHVVAGDTSLVLTGNVISSPTSGLPLTMQQRLALLRARVHTGSTRHVEPTYLTLGVFLTDVCTRLGQGAPMIATKVPIKRSGIDTSTPTGKKLAAAVQKCVYAGVLNQHSNMRVFDRPLRRRFLEEFFRTKLYLSIPTEKSLQDDDYVTFDYWESDFHYRVPTYYGVQRLLQLSSWGSNAAYTTDMLQSTHFEPFAQAYSQVQQQYHYISGGVTDETLLYGAIQGMVDSLHDPFSVYFPPEKTTDFFNSIQGEFYGVGAYVDSIDGYFTLQSIIKGSPAEEAGLQPGDRVIAVGAWEVPKVFTVNEVVAKIKGPAGSRVDLTIIRDGVQRVVNVERRKISIPLMTTGTQSDMFIWTISSFGLGLDQQFTDSLLHDAAQIGAAKKLVIDLRHNGGGYTDVVTRMLQSFVASGDIVMQYEYAHNTEQVRSQGSLNPIFRGKQIYILIDGSTASASEMMAGVIKEYVPGVKLVGEQTFGKGSMQALMGFPTGASAKYTIALWFYGSTKTSIEKVGIAPDIKVTDDRTTKNDEVLDAVSRN